MAAIISWVLLVVLAAGWRVSALAEDAGPPPAKTNTKTNIPGMSIEEAILLALRHNRTIQSAYLDRVAQKFDLKVAEDEFYPNLELISSFHHNDSTTEASTRTNTVNDMEAAQITLSESLPTGGTLTFSWENALDRQITDSAVSAKTHTQTGALALVQPLLKGGGIDVNMASLRTARLNEEQNILSLKATLIDTVTGVVSAFRNLVQANKEVDISWASLERTRQLLERNRLLIASGRMAAVEIVQVEADVANREYEYQATMNSIDSARLSLLMLLDMDKHTRIRPIPESEPRQVMPDLEVSTRLALANRPSYGQTSANLKIAQIYLRQAENNMLWDLSLDASYNHNRSDERLSQYATDTDAWRAGLKLSVPIYGDLTRQQRLTQARIDVKKAQLELAEQRANIEIEIQDMIREVASTWRQFELAGRALELSEQKLAIEEEKLNAGLSNNFQMVTFQNDLLDAQNQQIAASIAYSNALTALDQAIGTTLDTWNIEFQQDPSLALE